MPNPYIATEPIRIGTALGYVPGDEVSDAVVKKHGLQDSVSRADSKAAKDAEPPKGLSKP